MTHQDDFRRAEFSSFSAWKRFCQMSRASPGLMAHIAGPSLVWLPVVSINEFVSEHGKIREAETTGYKSNTECPLATPPCFPTTSVLETLRIAIFYIHTRIVHMYIEYTHVFIVWIYSSECIISTLSTAIKPGFILLGAHPTGGPSAMLTPRVWPNSTTTMKL